MSEQENIKLVQQAYVNFKSGDIESLVGLFSDDIKWQLPEVENVPYTGRREGRQEVAQFFASLAEAQDSLEFDPQEFIAQGAKVVATGQYRWRARETGRDFGGDWAHVFTIENGKITGFHEYTDTAAMASAFQKALSA